MNGHGTSTGPAGFFAAARALRARRALGVIIAVLAFPPYAAAQGDAAFGDDFDAQGVIEEASSPRASSSPDWWLNSGARFARESGVGRTLAGRLPGNDRWRLEYAASNPIDTEDGYRPQNVFRLLTRTRWRDPTQVVVFRIVRTNMTDSPNRGGDNGILLFQRYQDEQTLYYAGLRVDGFAVVKKKVAGRYLTLGLERVYPGTFDRDTRPNLLPTGRWIGLRTEMHPTPLGLSVRVDLLDPERAADWQPVLEVEDRGIRTGPVIPTPGDAGIRTDFMDVEFDRYEVSEGSSSTGFFQR